MISLKSAIAVISGLAMMFLVGPNVQAESGQPYDPAGE
ncbi:hypothetical protein ACVW0I_000722 [Bradyrhizobium sp. LM6.11]